MSFDISKWKKFLVTESREPELLEEALEDRVPVSVAEDIREDVRGRLRAACERPPPSPSETPAQTRGGFVVLGTGFETRAGDEMKPQLELESRWWTLAGAEVLDVMGTVRSLVRKGQVIVSPWCVLSGCILSL